MGIFDKMNWFWPKLFISDTAHLFNSKKLISQQTQTQPLLMLMPRKSFAGIETGGSYSELSERGLINGSRDILSSSAVIFWPKNDTGLSMELTKC